jgi:hypothetical protein
MSTLPVEVPEGPEAKKQPLPTLLKITTDGIVVHTNHRWFNGV